MSYLSQIEKLLGSFSSNPTRYIKEFEYLTQSYDLTWHNIYIILTSTLCLKEKERVWCPPRPMLMNYITRTMTNL